MPSIEVYVIIIIIFLLVYFVLNILSKRFTFKIFDTKFKRIIVSLILSPIICVGIFTVFVFFISYYPDRDFNQEDWISNPDTRYKMTEDLIDSELLVGKSKKQIIQLLGPADSTESTIFYDVGFLPGLFNIDPDIIEIKFLNGKVVEVIQRGT